ncbi:hypothetical protein EW026_g3001 [Hermanssonia centrifuga]|uniref:Cytochrome P450 n=1 Tax=Hermanssonia centrifuga TaxID=98765 RepID=A0A4S4KNF9_9APHY|nr:hypothetical protein EW026_g3001 [Hermanssonia centrifuga]
MGTQGLPKGPNWTARTLYPPILPIIATRDPVEHAQRRRPWNRGFSTAALKEYQPIIAKRVAQLVESLASEQGVVNLVERISFFTYDFMGDMAFGGGTEMLKEGDKDGLWGLIHKGLDSCIIYDHLPWLPHFVKLLPGGAGDIRKMRGTFLKRTASRFNAGSKTKDLFYYLSNEDGGDAQSPSPALVISDGALAVVAGSDTTASVLSNIFWCLLSHPEVYKRLQQEVDQYYPQQEDALDTTHHTKMFYLEAVINEALRLYPAVPSGSQRAPIPGEGDKVIGP